MSKITIVEPENRVIEGRFRFAATHYLAGRPAYSEALIARVASLTGLNSRHRLLDLGTGPGQLAVAFAPFAGEVIGIDPEPEMLRVAAENAEQQKVKVTFSAGSSNALDAKIGPLHLTTIGRAFHWMDRADTLRRLDQITEPGGAVVLFGHRLPKLPDNVWQDPYDSYLKPFREGHEAAVVREDTSSIPHEAILLDSPFPYLERISIIERRSTPVEHLIERAFSHGAIWPRLEALGTEEVTKELRAILAAYADTEGNIAEVVESHALIARRQRDQDQSTSSSLLRRRS
jgi:SAM-dependent methyltransferase